MQQVKYYIQRQPDNTYCILLKDLNTNKITIHSNHDSYEEADDMLTDLYSKPSKEDIALSLSNLKEI